MTQATAAEVRSALKLGALYDAGAPQLPEGLYYRIHVDSGNTYPAVKVTIMRERRWWFDEKIWTDRTPRGYATRHPSPQRFIATCCAEAWRVARLRIEHRETTSALTRWNGSWP